MVSIFSLLTTTIGTTT